MKDALKGRLNPTEEQPMPQSLSRVYVHISFSTKGRLRWLDEATRPRVHAHMATVARDSGCPYVHVGGTDDHVHVLADLGRKTALMTLVGKVKQESSRFAKTLGEGYHGFYWQSGYGAFSVGPTRRGDVEAYIDRQVEHHRTQTFQEEYRAFLERYVIDYDEQYVWD